jgi:hypothetical protein
VQTVTQPDTTVAADPPKGSPARLSVRTLRRLLRDAGRLTARLTRTLRRSKRKGPPAPAAAQAAQAPPAPAAPAEFAAHFSAGDPQERDGWVRRWAPLAFRAGDFDLPRIGPFRIGPEHIKAAVQEQPEGGYPIGDEHNKRSALMRRAGGSYGRAKLVPAPDYSAFGVETWFPDPVHRLLGPGPVGLSAHWCPLTKRLKQIDLTDNPRIDGAGLAALFSKEPDVTPTATPPAAAPAPAPAQPDLAARLADMEKREADYKARLEASERRQKESDDKLAAERDKRLLAEAAAFAREQGAGYGKDGRDLLAEAYFSLAADDREHGEATFSREGADAPRKGSRLDLLKKLVAKFREAPTVLDRDAYRGGAAFSNDAGPDAEAAKRKADRERMLAATDVGRRVLADEKNGAK